MSDAQGNGQKKAPAKQNAAKKNAPAKKAAQNRSAQQNKNGQQNGDGGQNGKGPSRNKNRKNRGKNKRVDPAEFWGDPTALPDLTTIDTSTPDPLAIPRSLGKAPVPGSPTERYFALIYTRSSAMAAALGSIVAGAEEIAVEQPIRET